MIKRILTLLFVIIIPFSIFGCDDDIPKISNKKNNNKSEEKENYKSEIEVEAQIYYTVSYQTNGGSNIRSEEYLKNGYLTKAPTTTKTGHIFDGWFLDSTLKTPVVFPLQITNDMTLYARWLKIEDTAQCKDCYIKLDSDYQSSSYYQITPSGFDINRLQELGYRKIKISVSYDFFYVKDYNALWDIGYAGSPRYEISLYNSDKLGDFQKDKSTGTSPSTRTINTEIPLSSISSDKITLEFSTNNIQNIIHFQNIIVTYQCVQ